MLDFFFSSRRRHTIYWRDWSSDVCSSDLVVLALRRDYLPTEPVLELDATFGPADGDPLSFVVLGDSTAAGGGAGGAGEIGRASGRGRVQISVGAVSVKKKRITRAVGVSAL